MERSMNGLNNSNRFHFGVQCVWQQPDAQVAVEGLAPRPPVPIARPEGYLQQRVQLPCGQAPTVYP